MTAMCAFFGISRAAYYAWRKRLDQPDIDAERRQLILEAYAASRRTYGYRRIGLMSLSNSVALVTRTLKLAKDKEKVTDGLILHSDQGHQYTSHHVLTQQYNIAPSMSRRANCWDNAPMENFFGHLKEEALRHIPIPTFEEAKQIVDEYIHFFNHERIQLKTRQTPAQVRCLST